MSEQEKFLYEAMTSGDVFGIDELRMNTFDSGDEEAVNQFSTDYISAYTRYQADHEMSEQEREEALAEAVQIENARAEEGAETEE